MKNIAIAVHGGAGEDSTFIRENKKAYEAGLKKAVRAGHRVLKDGGTASDAVITAVSCLENDKLFNAGKGSALNREGGIEMDASLMDGRHLKAGAVALLNNVKNPIKLALAVLQKTNHVMLAGPDAGAFAKEMGVSLQNEAYFKTLHQEKELLKSRGEPVEAALKKKVKGTVGAVALDMHGDIAAATSTGGTSGKMPGRVGDSCIIGAGCFADNRTCGVSGTGDGELLITGVIAHSISMMIELKAFSLQAACDYVIHEKNKQIQGDIGVISVNDKGDIGISFNSERMHRAWIDPSGVLQCKIYK